MTEYQPPTGGTTEQEIRKRFPALFMSEHREKDLLIKVK